MDNQEVKGSRSEALRAYIEHFDQADRVDYEQALQKLSFTGPATSMDARESKDRRKTNQPGGKKKPKIDPALEQRINADRNAFIEKEIQQYQQFKISHDELIKRTKMINKQCDDRLCNGG